MKRILLVVVLGFLMVPGAWAQVTGSSGCADPGPECRAGHFHTLPNGARYEGEVNVDGQPHGQGVMTWPDGGRYEGKFGGGKFPGEGVYTAPDGTRYAGEYEVLFDGRGVLTWPDGRRVTCFPCTSGGCERAGCDP